MTALGRAHAQCREALDQLDVAIAVAGGIEDVADLQVFVQIDELLALGVREQRPAMLTEGA